MEYLERQLSTQFNQITTLGEYFTWVQQCDEYIQQLEECSSVKRPRLSTGNRQSIVATIARLTSLKAQLQRRFIHFGGDYACDRTVERLFWRKIDAAFENRILTGAVINVDYIEPRLFLEDAGDVVIQHVQDSIKKHNSVKVNTVFNGEFVTGDKHANKSINTKNYELMRTSDLHKWYKQLIVESTLTSLEEFQERDSGWALSRILDLTININMYNPMHAGCHHNLPQELIFKKAVINVQSNDNACFAWSVVAALYPSKDHPQRTSSYPQYTKSLNLKEITFPVTLKDITTFERHNEISVNVYSLGKQKPLTILPLRLTKNIKKKHVNLLYISDQNDDNVGHFVLIKDLSRLVSSKLSKKGHKKHICDR